MSRNEKQPTAFGIVKRRTMSAMTPDSLSDLLACVAAFGRSLDESFDPTRFLAEFSARSQRLVPHDYMLIALREDDGQTYSIFAEYAVRGSLRGDNSRYTAGFERGRRVAAECVALAPVFGGETQLIADRATDDRFGEAAACRAGLGEAGLRARLAVPLFGGGHGGGALVVMSATAGIYTEAHASTWREVADLIGPFVETVVVLHRERRRRERLAAATGLPPILGASLKVGDVLERLGEAVRPLIDFEVMGLAVRAADGQGFERIGISGARRPGYPATPTTEDYSVLERVSRGEVILVRDAQRELDPKRPGDRYLIESGDRSLLGVPLLFGEQVGGVLFFVTPREHWYDKSDVEVASAIAAALVLAVQHQRLAEQQQQKTRRFTSGLTAESATAKGSTVSPVPRFPARVGSFEGRRVFTMARAEWERLTAHEGELVEIDVERVPTVGVGEPASVIACLASQYSVHTARIEVWRYDEKDRAETIQPPEVPGP